MPSVLLLVYVFSFGATALAWTTASEAPDYRPVANLLTFGLLSDIIRRVLWVRILARAYEQAAGAPLVGIAWSARALHEALFLGWPAGVVALAFLAFTARSRSLPIAIVYVLVAGVCAFGHPAIGGALLNRIRLTAESLAVLVAAGLVVQWFLRGARPTLLVVSTALIVGIETTTLVGPYLAGPFENWNGAQLLYTMLFGALIIVQGGRWISRLRSS